MSESLWAAEVKWTQPEGEAGRVEPGQGGPCQLRGIHGMRPLVGHGQGLRRAMSRVVQTLSHCLLPVEATASECKAGTVCDS